MPLTADEIRAAARTCIMATLTIHGVTNGRSTSGEITDAILDDLAEIELLRTGLDS